MIETDEFSGIRRWARIFKTVDWLIPAYLTKGFLSGLAKAIDDAEEEQKVPVLCSILSIVYDEQHCSCMLLNLYGKQRFIQEFRVQINEAFEAFWAGLPHAAVATLLTVIEGVIRLFAKSQNSSVGQGTKGLVRELTRILDREIQSEHSYGERVVMLETLRDFFNERLLKNDDVYEGFDQFNRHGILHGKFQAYGSEANFYRL
jgi:hypothetical protein